MIEYPVEQGSAAWRTLRIGLPTASQMHRIVTPARGELSKQARAYLTELMTETILDEPLDDMIAGLPWIERGRMLEAEAAARYAFETDHELRAPGLITTDDGQIGASLDRLVIGQPGAVEIKCPAPWTHLRYMLDGPEDDYRPQVQAQMMVAELAWVDFVSYHPRLPLVVHRIERDEAYIARMRAALAEFCAEKARLLARLRTYDLDWTGMELDGQPVGARGKKAEHSNARVAGPVEQESYQEPPLTRRQGQATIGRETP